MKNPNPILPFLDREVFEKMVNYITNSIVNLQSPPHPFVSKSHSVYIFKCDCDTSNYIGETERTTLTRIMGHKPHLVNHPTDEPGAPPIKSSQDKDHLIKYEKKAIV